MSVPPAPVKFIPKLKILNDYRYDAVTEQTELLWRCWGCGRLSHRKDGLPAACPSCGASQREMALVEED
jgi:rubrerythrin